MSQSSRPSAPVARRRVAGCGLMALSLLALPAAGHGQAADRWVSTADRYDDARVAAFVSELGDRLADRHGPLADAIYAMNAELMRTPNPLDPRSSGPAAEPIRYRVEASHLVHYQAGRGGSLGRLHGATTHPVGVGWFPHSMFAQSGGVYGRWGHARLLGAVRSYQERHAD